MRAAHAALLAAAALALAAPGHAAIAPSVPVEFTVFSGKPPRNLPAESLAPHMPLVLNRAAPVVQPGDGLGGSVKRAAAAWAPRPEQAGATDAPAAARAHGAAREGAIETPTEGGHRHDGEG